MSSATAGVIVQPKIDYIASEDGSSITYKAEVKGEGRIILCQLLSAPFILCGLGALFFLPLVGLASGSSSSSGVGGLLVGVLVVCIAAVIVLKAVASTPRTVPVHFDEKGITIAGQTYLMEHVSFIGWREFGNSKNGYGQIYIKYGGTEITLLHAVHFIRTEAVYFDFQKFLKRVGHNFNN